MAVSVEQDDSRFVIRMEGEIGLTEAGELKRMLLEGLASVAGPAGSGRRLELNLEHVREIDVSFMQLWQAALREAERLGTRFVVRMSLTAQTAVRGAGWSG